MSKFASFIVHKRYFILVLFVAIMIFSVFSTGWVGLEADIKAYLSEESDSKICLNISTKEFKEYASAYLLVKGIPEEECHELATSVEDISNVAYTRSDIHAIDQDGHYSVTLFISFMSTPTDTETRKTVDELNSLVEPYETKYVYCEALEDVSSMIVEQMKTVMLLIAVVVLTVLLFTSGSFAEILVMLLVFIASAVLGLGTNFLFGTISLISAAVSVALQLALSVDYAIILCDRYKTAHETLPCQEAVMKALASAVPEVLASSLTTIAGLFALTLMQFRFGLDLGLVLIKSILCSIITVFLLMPVLLVLFGNLMDKTRHRSFIPKINFLGKFAFATRFVMPFIFVAVAVAGLLISENCNFSFNAKEAPSKRPSENVLAFKAIGEESSTNLLQILVPVGNYESETALVNELAQYDEIKSVTGLGSIDAPAGHKMYDKINYVDFQEIASLDELSCQALFAFYSAEKGDYRTFMDNPSEYTIPVIDILLFLQDNKDNPTLNLSAEQINQINSSLRLFSRVCSELRGTNYARILVQLNYATEEEGCFDFLETIPQTAKKYYSEVYIAGNSVAAKDFADSFKTDRVTVSAVSIIFVVLILLLTFKTVALPVLLIVVIQGSIWINFAIPSVTQDPIFFICYLIVSSIQMGSNIDYAIVISSRYLELRKTSNDRRQIIIETINFAFPTVITSALMMISAGFLVGYLVTEGVVAGFGYYIATGTIVTLFLVNFVLPQILLLGDAAIMKTQFTLPKVSLPHIPVRQIAGIALAIASILALFATPIGWIWCSGAITEDTASLNRSIDEVNALEEEAASFQETYADIDSVKYAFAESYLTQKEGSIQLSVGEAQLQEGANQLAEGQKEYDENYALYQDALADLEEGQQQIDQGEAQYNKGLASYNANKKQYDSGLAQYNAGKAQYDAGKQAYEEGLAAYESGLAQYNAGKAEYDAGVEQYNSSKAEYDAAVKKLDSVTPIYNLVKSPYAEYREAKQQYDEAVSSGDNARALGLKLKIQGYESLFNTQLVGTGYSITSLVEEYEAGKAQLADAKQQLSDAEARLSAAKETLAANKVKLDDAAAQLESSKTQLAAAESQLASSKAQLDSGKARLDSGKAQLANAKSQLESGKAELAEGQAQAADAEAQLAEGKETLDENYEKLSEAQDQLNEGRSTLQANGQKLTSNLATLDAYTSRKNSLDASIRSLLADSDIYISADLENNRIEVCNTLRSEFENSIQKNENSYIIALLSVILLIMSAITGLLIVIFWLRFGAQGYLLGMAVGVLCSTVLGFILYFVVGGFSSIYVVIPALVLLICSIVSLVMINHQYHSEH